MFGMQLNSVFWIAAASCGLFVGQVSSAPIDVVIMAGQSNMVGGGSASDLPAELRSQSDIRYSYLVNPDRARDPGLPDAFYTSDGWGDLIPRNNTHFGPEMTFGRTVADAQPDRELALIKIASDATNLRTAWRKGATGGPRLYQTLLDEVATALALLVDDGYEPTVTGVVWVQGSGDADLPHAVAYQQHLTNLIANLRDDLANPDLAFVYNEYHIDSDRDGVAEIRASQRNVAAADPLAGLINLDDQDLRFDNIHFTSQTHQVAGQRLAQAYLALVPEPGSAALVLSAGGMLLGLRRR